MTRPVWFRRIGTNNQISPNPKPRLSLPIVPSMWQGWLLMLAVIVFIVLASFTVPPYFADAAGRPSLLVTAGIIIGGLAIFYFLAAAFSAPADTQDSKDDENAQDQ